MKTPFSLAKLGAAALLLTSLTSCEDILEEYFPRKPDTPGFNLDIPFYALSADNKLDAYSTSNPTRSTASVSITGLQSGEKLIGIDFRPATGQLYGLGSTSRIYVINQKTGAARAIGAGAFTPALEGDVVGFDFNPTVDRIRVVTNTGQNHRLNPETGAGVIVDGTINGVPGAGVTGAAYTNSVAGAATTVLYDLDPATNKLYRQDPPNAGTLVAVGDLKLDISGNGGFDIDAKTGTALALYDVSGQSTLFAVNLSTGATQTITKFNNSAGYIGLAIPTRAVAYGTSSDNTLYIFDPNAPATVVSKPITGLASGETIRGLDFRPANGQLYALSSGSRLYTLNASSGVAALVGTLSTTVANGPVGFDFNPVVDRIRIVTSSGQNLRVNPADGVAIVDGTLNPSEKGIFAAAYSNNFAGTTTTTLYNLGSVFLGNAEAQRYSSALYQQMPPNEGTLVEVGSTGRNTIIGGSFDIGGTSNKGYAALSTAFLTRSVLATVNLQTGEVSEAGTLPEEVTVDAFTVGLGF